MRRGGIDVKGGRSSRKVVHDNDGELQPVSRSVILMDNAYSEAEDGNSEGCIETFTQDDDGEYEDQGVGSDYIYICIHMYMCIFIDV
jgi:hypothetical protein